MSGDSNDFPRFAASLDEPVIPITDGYAGGGSIDGELVWEALGTVIDPEIGLDIVTLGLVYGVRLSGSSVCVTFTLTTRGCPMQGIITEGIESAVATVPGVREIVPDLVWEPQWDPSMIREGAW
jgi:metal-sulfur cluster biosynthetic enzyme